MFKRRDGGKRTEKKQKGMRSHLQVMSRISKKLHLAVRLITGKRRIAAIFRAVKVLEELHNGENVSKKRKKKGKGRSLNCTLAPNMRLIVRQLSCCGTCWRGILHFIPPPPPPCKKNTHRRRDKQAGAVHLPPGIEANGVGVTRADDGRGRKPGQSRRLHPQKSELKPERG